MLSPETCAARGPDGPTGSVHLQQHQDTEARADSGVSVHMLAVCVQYMYDRFVFAAAVHSLPGLWRNKND